MPRGRTRIMAALIAGGLVAGSLGGGFALAASKSEEAMHHGHAMKHGSSTSHDQASARTRGCPRVPFSDSSRRMNPWV